MVISATLLLINFFGCSPAYKKHYGCSAFDHTKPYLHQQTFGGRDRANQIAKAFRELYTIFRSREALLRSSTRKRLLFRLPSTQCRITHGCSTTTRFCSRKNSHLTASGERGLHAYMPYHLGLVELSMEFQGFLMGRTVLFAINMESCIVGRRSV